MKRSFWRRASLVALSIVTAAALFAVAPPQKAAAWQSLGTQWTRIGATLSVCVDDAFGDDQNDRVADALGIWNDISAGSLTLVVTRVNADCDSDNFSYDIVIDRVPETELDVVGKTDSWTSGSAIGWDGVTRVRLYHSYIRLDGQWVTDSYWGNGGQACTVHPSGSGCKPDGKTAVAHEVGHALGFAHSFGGSCDGGYSSSSYALACSGNKVKIMSSGDANCSGEGSAGYEFSWCGGSPATQGYRHNTVGADIENGLHDMYGP